MSTCCLQDFGGISDGVFDNTEVFIKAISHLQQLGGGTLLVTPGIWRTGPLTLFSNCILEIADGATISFIGEFHRYRPVWTRWEGVECHAMQPCIQARDASHVVIAGGGTIDGNGHVWWQYRNMIRSNAEHTPSLTIEKELAGLNPGYREQPGGGGGRHSQFLAPPVIQLYRCTDSVIEGISIVDSPFWTIHPLYCHTLRIERVKVFNPSSAPNTDGLDIDSCSDVVVSDCLFDVGDDAIALKSGSGTDGMRVGIPTRNIRITGCEFHRAHGGIVVGSETAGGIADVVGSDCRFFDTDRGVRIKTRRGRGGIIENLRFTRMTMERTLCPIAINMYYRCGILPEEEEMFFSTTREAVDPTTPQIRKIVVEDLHASGCRSSAGFFVGLPESPIEDLSLVDCHIDTHSDQNVSPGESEMYTGLPPVSTRGIRFRNCRNLSMEQVMVDGPVPPILVEEGVEFL